MLYVSTVFDNKNVKIYLNPQEIRFKCKVQRSFFNIIYFILRFVS